MGHRLAHRARNSEHTHPPPGGRVYRGRFRDIAVMVQRQVASRPPGFFLEDPGCW